jgi:hypothetical protein
MGNEAARRASSFRYSVAPSQGFEENREARNGDVSQEATTATLPQAEISGNVRGFSSRFSCEI